MSHSSAEMPLEISVILPCLNEAETVGACVRKARDAMAAMGAAGEIVVVDNGSTDDTVARAETEGARVVRETARGYGSALRSGFAAARGKFLVMADADESYDLADIERFIAPLRAGVDVVMGSRLRGRILPGAMPWRHRWLGIPFLTWLLNVLHGTRVSDAHCGMRSLSREAFLKMDLRTTGMEFASEMLMETARLRLRIEEIPITYHPDGRSRHSNLRPVRDAMRHLGLLLREVIRNHCL